MAKGKNRGKIVEIRNESTGSLWAPVLRTEGELFYYNVDPKSVVPWTQKPP